MKKITSIEICRKSHLPEKGWLQACFNCYSITSKTFEYGNIRKFNNIFKISVYLCPGCKKALRKDVLLYNYFCIDCNDYIKKNYIALK